jgi:hypothetical protein
MFHLLTHAFFKAMLFLGAGSVIHGMHHEQTCETTAVCATKWTFRAMMIGTLAIWFGIPLLYNPVPSWFWAPCQSAIIGSAYAAGGLRILDAGRGSAVHQFLQLASDVPDVLANRAATNILTNMRRIAQRDARRWRSWRLVRSAGMFTTEAVLWKCNMSTNIFWCGVRGTGRARR